MLSPKSPNVSYYLSPRRASQPNKSSGYNSLEVSKTEEQQDRIKKLLNDVRRGGPLSPKAVILPQSELMRMKNYAAVLTKEEQVQQKKIAEEQHEKQHAAAKAKKQKMLEIEAERKKSLPTTGDELTRHVENGSMQARAQTLMNEELDDVKHMNQMMFYARVVTIRDKQLGEKKDIYNQMKDEEFKKDILMEVERLKNIKYHEELDRIKKEENKRRAVETIKQIKERELERLRAQEEVEREGREIVKRLQELQIEEANNGLLRKKQQKIIMDQIVESNHRTIVNKQENVRREKEEDEKIGRYLVERAQKEAEKQAEIKRLQDEKEREVQRLRELQEKESDRNAELDAIRAKRAFELADRQAREKEKKEAEVRVKIDLELAEARRVQATQKDVLVQEQVKHEKEEFSKVIQAQKAHADMELKAEQERKRRMYENALQVKKQISNNEEKKKIGVKEHLEEGKKLKDKLNGEKRLLEGIKARKLDELGAENIPSKYTAELAKKRIIY